METSTTLQYVCLTTYAHAPVRGSAFAAGWDLHSAYDTVVPARRHMLVRTDVAIAIPYGTYGRIAPRSGLALHHGLDVGAGVVDYDYRGPVGVILFNHTDVDFHIHTGDRIAQLILERICNATLQCCNYVSELAQPHLPSSSDPSSSSNPTTHSLESRVRGTLGFGSSDSVDGVDSANDIQPTTESTTEQ
jgi:dUTP pyrophosphatase